MKKIDFKLKPTFNLLGIVLLIGFTSITLGLAQESAKESKIPATEGAKNGTRIVISTSGPAKFTSYWLDNPPRLAVEFKTKNVVSKIGSELLVNEGAIKRITSEYYGGAQSKILKSLTFELQEKVPYKIWQEADTILLDIQTPQELSVFPEEGREVFAKNETKDAIIKRLEAMDAALKQVVVTQVPSETPKSESTKLVGEFPEVERRGKTGSMSWFVGLILIAGLGFLLRRKGDIFIKAKRFFAELRKFLNRPLSNLGNFWQRKSTYNKNGELTPSGESNVEKTVLQETPILKKPIFIAKIRILTDTFKRKFKFKNRKKDILNAEINRLKTELEQKNKVLEQEEIIRKTIENTAIAREKEFEHLKTELQEEKQILEQEQEARKIAEEGLSQKEKEVVEVKDSLESLKEVLVEKGIAKKFTAAGKEGELWIAGKSLERREFPRLDLSKDYNRTIILRIESQDKTKSIKSFANNISVEGLCFETRREFKEKESINLRLFFFGDNVPMIRTKAKVIWSRTDLPINYYGISFVSVGEKDKANLSHYIESKISECTTYGTK